MPSSFCRICGRKLRNPISVELGIGPVCRCQAKGNKQGVFDFMHAQTEILKYERDNYILIRDIGFKSGFSVTNDAEYIVKQLYLDFDITDYTRIFYKDSEGEIDELVHDGKTFTRFRPGHAGIELAEGA